jgi:hypothetical protein
MLDFIINRITTFFKWINWHTSGKPYIKYAGFHCGCCGKWTKQKFRIRKYQSAGQWADTWGLCDECGNMGVDLSGPTPKRANPPVDFDTVECSNDSVMITPKFRSGD